MPFVIMEVSSPGEPAGAEPPPPPPRRPGRARRLLRRLARLALWGLGGAAGLLLLAFVALALWLNLSPDRGVDVLLFTIDTQRIDGLGCYGAGDGRTPHLDRLASRGVLFERTVVSIPRTTQNISTLHTGLEPKDHGVRELFDHLPDGVATLAERLQAMGYRTGAFVGGGPLGEDQNLYQGFDEVHVHAFEDQVRALPVMLTASSWIVRNGAGPWFAWVHVYDPHFFYSPPWPFWDRADPGMPAVAELYERLGRREATFSELHYENRLPDPERQTLEKLYRGETSWVDFSFGWLLRCVGLLERLDPGRRTLVVVTADHGEGLGEHGCFYNHGVYLYDEDLLVPLLISLPGTLPESRRVPQQVRTVDVYPTILDLVGDPEPRPPLAGASLLPLISQRETDDRLAFSEGDTNRHPHNPRFHYPAEEGITGRWRSVRDGRFKLIRVPRPEGDVYELYDLEADPGETRPVNDERPEVFERLAARLAAWEREPPRQELDRDRSQDDEPLEDKLERLRSLGYVN